MNGEGSVGKDGKRSEGEREIRGDEGGDNGKKTWRERKTKCETCTIIKHLKKNNIKKNELGVTTKRLYK